MRAWATCGPGAAPLSPPFGLNFRDVRTAKHAFELVPDVVATAALYSYLAGCAVADGVVDPSGQMALRGHHVELGQPSMVDGLRGFDELLSPGDGFVMFNQITEERRGDGDGGRGVQVTVVGDPPKRGAQV